MGRKRFRATYADGTPAPSVHVRDDDGAGRKRVWWEPVGVETGKLALYGSDELTGDETTLVIVEGERAREAVAAITPAVATYGAGLMPSDAALEVCRGMEVVRLGPDNDVAGRQHMAAVGRRILELGLAAEVLWINPPGPAEPSWDLADATPDELVAALALAVPFAGSGAPVETPGATQVDVVVPSSPADADEALPLARNAVKSMEDVGTTRSWAVHDVAYYGCLVVVAAFEGSGKSHIRSQLAFSMIRQTKFLGEFDVDAPSAVLVVDMEMGELAENERDAMYMDEMGVTRDDVGPYLWRFTLDFADVDLGDTRWIDHLGRECDRLYQEMGRPVALLVDSISSTFTEPLLDQPLTRLMRNLRLLRHGRREWLTIWLFAHTVKQNRDARYRTPVDIESVRGNLTQQSDVVVILEPKDEMSMLMKLRKRVPRRRDVVLQRDEGSHLWRATTDAVASASTKVAAHTQLEVLRQIGETTAYEFSKLIDVSKSTAQRYLEELVRKRYADSDTRLIERRQTVVYWPLEVAGEANSDANSASASSE